MRLLPFTFLAALLVTWAATFAVRRFALARGIVAKHDLRRRHDQLTPLLGGTGFYVVFLGVTCVYYWLGDLDTRFFAMFSAAISIIYVVGALDDAYEIGPLPKFAGQVAAALLVIHAKQELPGLFRDDWLPPAAVTALLVVWIVGVMNATNFIDGLDGLCTGVAGISAITLAAITVTSTSLYPVVMLVALAGAAAGFLVHNFNPAKIFLGDSGSLLLGFVLAVFSMYIDVKRSLFISMSIPILLLCVPLFDLVLAVARRSYHRRSIFKGDHSHLHHRLQQIGLGHRGTVLCLWAVTAYLNCIAFTIANLPANNTFYIYLLTTPVLGFLMATLRFIEGRLSHQITSYSHLFLDDWQRQFSDKGALISKIERNEPFLLFVIDYELTLHDIAQRRPSQVIEFFMDLYKSVKGGLRKGDFLTRITEYRVAAVVAIPAKASLHVRKTIEARVKSRIQESQARQKIFTSDTAIPEGLTILSFPEDSQAIIDTLDLEHTLVQFRKTG